MARVDEFYALRRVLEREQYGFRTRGRMTFLEISRKALSLPKDAGYDEALSEIDKRIGELPASGV